MLKLGARGQRWLKTLHLFAVACWVGGAVSLMQLHLLRLEPLPQGGALAGIDMAAHAVDMGVVVLLGAMSCLCTGLAYSVCTGWGFFRHRWLTVKWALTVAAIVFGTACLGPWETAMGEISARLGLGALSDPDYLWNRRMNLGFGLVQVLALVFTLWLSVFKPWKTKG
jgi:uncharacterized membrane protein